MRARSSKLTMLPATVFCILVFTIKLITILFRALTFDVLSDKIKLFGETFK